MRIARVLIDGQKRIGYLRDASFVDCGEQTLDALLQQDVDLTSLARHSAEPSTHRADALEYCQPLEAAPKVLCVGLNYADHTTESNYKQPDYPTIFLRCNTSLIAHGEPLVRPRVSHRFDYEGEMAVVLRRGGRHIAKADALNHVAGYSIFNDGSVRDFQHRTPQWTLGKNFDGTGSFGPVLVTPDELPPGASGLRLTTRLNGTVVQSGNTRDLIFDVATLIAIISECMSLEAGDVLVTGTPAGVGHSRVPPLYMKAGDVCEVEIEGLGTLSNPVEEESGPA